MFRSFAVTALTAVLLSATPAVWADGADPPEQTLSGRFGYLVIDTHVERKVLDWRLNDRVVIDQLPEGVHLRLLRLPAGRYQWQSVRIPWFGLAHEFDLSDDEAWSFEIERGSINYFGTMLVGEDRSRRSADVRLMNRTADMLPRLRAAFPSAVAAYPVRWAGRERDDFLPVLQETSR